MQAHEMNLLVSEFLSCLLSARAAQDQNSQFEREESLRQASEPASRIKDFALRIIAKKWNMLHNPEDASQEAMTRLVKAYLDPRLQPPRIEGDGFNYVYTVFINTGYDAWREQSRHSGNVIQQDQPAQYGSPSTVVAAPSAMEAGPPEEASGEPAKSDGAGWLDEPASFTHDLALSLDVIRRIDEFARTYNNLPNDRMPHPEMLRHMVEGSSILDIAHAWFKRDVTLTEESRVKKWKEATRKEAQVFFHDLNTGRKG